MGLQLSEVRQCLDYRQKEIRVLASNALLEQLAFVDKCVSGTAHQVRDVVFRAPNGSDSFALHQQRVVDMFFPYVSLLLERAEFIKSLLGGKVGPPSSGGADHEHRKELRSWLSAFLYVCRDSSPNLLRGFLR